MRAFVCVCVLLELHACGAYPIMCVRVCTHACLCSLLSCLQGMFWHGTACFVAADPHMNRLLRLRCTMWWQLACNTWWVGFWGVMLDASILPVCSGGSFDRKARSGVIVLSTLKHSVWLLWKPLWVLDSYLNKFSEECRAYGCFRCVHR